MASKLSGAPGKFMSHQPVMFRAATSICSWLSYDPWRQKSSNVGCSIIASHQAELMPARSVSEESGSASK
jgi:hypothetical protein